MTLGKLRDSDIGHWLLGDDGQAVRLIRIHGPILLVQTKNGRVYWPVHDIERRINEEEAKKILGNFEKMEMIPVKKKKLVQPYKRVIRTDLTGKEVTFPSIKEAALQSGVSAPTVSMVCNGIKENVRGYTFRFENQNY